MQKPRIFISSTFYDLEQAREDLERFIKNLGYDSILSEKGDVTYGKDKSLENYCYEEVENSDIIVALIGGRFGSSSQYSNRSITQEEIEAALEKNKRIYIFIKNDVHTEFSTYKLNKDNPDIIYNFVDDKKIYEFIEKIYSLKKNNPIFPFETLEDVITILQKQWAGIFADLLKKETGEIKNETYILDKNISQVEEDDDSEFQGNFITGELLHSKFWGFNDENNVNEISTDIDGDGIKEIIYFGRQTPNGTSLLIGIGKDFYELGFDIKGLEEFGECGGGCQVAIKDVTNDGYPEILFAFSTGNIETHLNIFQFDKEKYLNSIRGEKLNPFNLIGYLTGQTEFRILNGGKIEIPYGSQGLYDTYIWNGKKFVPDFEEELLNIFKDFLKSLKLNKESSFLDSKTKKKFINEKMCLSESKSKKYSKLKENFMNFELFQSEEVVFKNNKAILMVSGKISTKNSVNVNKKLKISFIEENNHWKIII